jgi:hypothetical protein
MFDPVVIGRPAPCPGRPRRCGSIVSGLTCLSPLQVRRGRFSVPSFGRPARRPTANMVRRRRLIVVPVPRASGCDGRPEPTPSVAGAFVNDRDVGSASASDVLAGAAAGLDESLSRAGVSGVAVALFSRASGGAAAGSESPSGLSFSAAGFSVVGPLLGDAAPREISSLAKPRTI